MTPTDDRGAAALAERLCMAQERNDLAHVADTTATWWREVAAHALGERGRFLPDGTDFDDAESWGESSNRTAWRLYRDNARLRKIETAARAFLYDGTEGIDPPPDDEWADTALALRAALGSEG